MHYLLTNEIYVINVCDEILNDVIMQKAPGISLSEGVPYEFPVTIKTMHIPYMVK